MYDSREFRRRSNDLNSRTQQSWIRRGVLRPARDTRGRYVFTDADIERVRPRVELIAQRATTGPHEMAARAALELLTPAEADVAASAAARFAQDLTT